MGMIMLLWLAVFIGLLVWKPSRTLILDLLTGWFLAG